MVPRRIIIFWLLTLTLPTFVPPYCAISMSRKLLNMQDYDLRQLRYLGLYCTSREFFLHLIRADLGLTGNINSLHESPSIRHHILKSWISATNCGMVSTEQVSWLYTSTIVSFLLLSLISGTCLALQASSFKSTDVNQIVSFADLRKYHLQAWRHCQMSEIISSNFVL